MNHAIAMQANKTFTLPADAKPGDFFEFEAALTTQFAIHSEVHDVVLDLQAGRWLTTGRLNACIKLTFKQLEDEMGNAVSNIWRAQVVSGWWALS